MMKINKILSVFLAVLLLISVMSVTAFAAEGSTTLTTTIPCTVTLQVGDHGKVTVNSTDYTGSAVFQAEAGTALTYTFTPNTLYRIDKVIYNGVEVTGELSGGAYTAPALTGNAALSVSFKLIGGGTPTYTVTFNANGHGTAPAAQTVLSGYKAAEPPAPTESGWVFGGWYREAACTNAFDFSAPITGNLTLYAKWTKSSGGGGGGTYYSYYTIKATAGANGSITPSGSVSVREGRDQTFTITPDQGYAVSNVKIDGKSIGAVKSYTFENVRKSHTIEAVFMKAGGNPQTGVFVDVATGSYYEDAVDWAVEKGITTGTDNTHFSPDGICTRAQAVTFLWRAAGSPAPKSGAMPFSDVKSGAYYYDAVLWAVENGITKGTSDTTFSPNMTCSRGQIVTFLWRSRNAPAAGTVNPFADVKSTAYYAGAVLWAVENGITKGTGAATFSPNADCTRAQIVTFIYRCMK